MDQHDNKKQISFFPLGHSLPHKKRTNGRKKEQNTKWPMLCHKFPLSTEMPCMMSAFIA